MDSIMTGSPPSDPWACLLRILTLAERVSWGFYTSSSISFDLRLPPLLSLVPPFFLSDYATSTVVDGFLLSTPRFFFFSASSSTCWVCRSLLKGRVSNRLQRSIPPLNLWFFIHGRRKPIWRNERVKIPEGPIHYFFLAFLGRQSLNWHGWLVWFTAWGFKTLKLKKLVPGPPSLLQRVDDY